MKELHLHIDQMVSGKFSPKKLNLLLLFQVNCPGCFLYALPTFNQLYAEHGDEIGFIALSTAFEDFGLNTHKNTELLVSEGKLVGETQKAYKQQGYPELPFRLHFPVGIDKKMAPDQKAELTESICSLNPGFPTWSEHDRNLIRARVAGYLDDQTEVSLTFTANQFRGTPTMALFTDHHVLLASWFGHTPIKDIVHKIEAHKK